MSSVEIVNVCSCAMKRGLPERQDFDDTSEAREEAERLLEKMRFEFCKKHRFELKEEFGSFRIYIYANR